MKSVDMIGEARLVWDAEINPERLSQKVALALRRVVLAWTKEADIYAWKLTPEGVEFHGGGRLQLNNGCIEGVPDATRFQEVFRLRVADAFNAWHREMAQRLDALLAFVAAWQQKHLLYRLGHGGQAVYFSMGAWLL